MPIETPKIPNVDASIINGIRIALVARLKL